MRYGPHLIITERSWSTMSKLPLIQTADPKADFMVHETAIREAIERVLVSGYYVLGPEVSAFESEWSEYLGGGRTIGVANGTDALEIALRAMDVKAGDRVATVANTVSATVAAIQQIGAHPVFVEIDDASMTMSPSALAELLANSDEPIRAVIPVHLYGRPAPMPEIVAVAAKYGAKVLEDCAQAHGAEWNQQKVGTFGDAAAFSFYPTKNLGGLGDGGAVFTRDESLANKVFSLRQYGWQERYVSATAGRNSRLDEIQAAILRVKIGTLDADNTLRARHAHCYLHQLSDSSLRLPPADNDVAKSVWHQFTVRTPRREQLRAHLAAQGVHCGVLYPVPLHKQPAYFLPVDLPLSEQACEEVLCLPVHPRLRSVDIDRIVQEILRWSAP